MALLIRWWSATLQRDGVGSLATQITHPWRGGQDTVYYVLNLCIVHCSPMASDAACGRFDSEHAGLLISGASSNYYQEIARLSIHVLSTLPNLMIEVLR